MTDPPKKLSNFNIDSTDEVVREYLREHYLDHPTRGSYFTSRELYDAIVDEIDDRYNRQLFGVFCSSRPYLERQGSGYSGSSRYKIIVDELTAADQGSGD